MKRYKEVEITPEEAYELLKANDMKPVDGFVFWDDDEVDKTRPQKLTGAAIVASNCQRFDGDMIFKGGDDRWWQHCARLVEESKPDMTADELRDALSRELMHAVDSAGDNIFGGDIICPSGIRAICAVLANHGITAERGRK